VSEIFAWPPIIQKREFELPPAANQVKNELVVVLIIGDDSDDSVLSLLSVIPPDIKSAFDAIRALALRSSVITNSQSHHFHRMKEWY
jgi:hypothetical protein